MGRRPQTLLALAAVPLYAALDDGAGPAAIHAAIMGALLALAVPAMTAVEPLVIYDADSSGC